MKKLITLLCLLLIPFSLNAAISFKYTFSKKDNFEVAFADYPKDQESFYELLFEQEASLPPEIKTNLPGLKISGNNHSDDLFMYAYKKITGLKANTQYHVNFSLEFASNAATESPGQGGSPGSSVYMKMGLLSDEPKRVFDENQYYRMVLDKGNQMLDGKDMIIIGNIGVDSPDGSYRLKTLPYQPDAEMQKKLDNYSVTSNAMGEAWLIVGTDSGYESITTLFYTNLVVSLQPKRL